MVLYMYFGQGGVGRGPKRQSRWRWRYLEGNADKRLGSARENDKMNPFLFFSPVGCGSQLFNDQLLTSVSNQLGTECCIALDGSRHVCQPNVKHAPLVEMKCIQSYNHLVGLDPPKVPDGLVKDASIELRDVCNGRALQTASVRALPCRSAASTLAPGWRWAVVGTLARAMAVGKAHIERRWNHKRTLVRQHFGIEVFWILPWCVVPVAVYRCIHVCGDVVDRSRNMWVLRPHVVHCINKATAMCQIKQMAGYYPTGSDHTARTTSMG